ncbi:hypothetical protein B0T14DRAFT_338746 [Immersiella caudata]|uniref:Uncharacterized protein n=1 Tax=Immersiella caudata TaxID=314043 RepID=A0AA39TTB8_9PEZI|nr:hypothetical protein B0T14DRAFT_338746 [Immersiella caudata]
MPHRHGFLPAHLHRSTETSQVAPTPWRKITPTQQRRRLSAKLPSGRPPACPVVRMAPVKHLVARRVDAVGRLPRPPCLAEEWCDQPGVLGRPVDDPIAHFPRRRPKTSSSVAQHRSATEDEPGEGRVTASRK